MEFEPMLTPRKKSPLPKMSPEEDRTRDAVDSEPKHYQLSYSGPSHTSNLENDTLGATMPSVWQYTIQGQHEVWFALYHYGLHCEWMR